MKLHFQEESKPSVPPGQNVHMALALTRDHKQGLAWSL